jgi:PTS system fructose-specific IIA component/PTS system nitrogen regulatory IIA component
MKLSELLTPDQILLPFHAADKWQAIKAMPAALVAAGRLPAHRAATATDALIIRERSMTTGMENGIAIPHAALDELTDLLCILAIAPDGIDFDTLDGGPGRILVGLLIPRAEKLLHIRTLAEIAKLLSRAEVRARLLACGDRDEVLAAIIEEER